MQPEFTRAGPVNLTDRILFIDVLRGMALFGILAANMRAFFAPLDAYDNINALYPSRPDIIAQAFIQTFFQGKFISIFSFLFGLGFAMQFSRAEARGVRFVGFYPRRLLALGLFGVIHGALIWSGDILLTYAVAGGILLLFRNRRQTTLLWWAGGLFSLPIVAASIIYSLYFTRFHQRWMEPKPPNLAKLHAVINTYAHGTVWQIARQNLIEFKQEAPLTLFAFYAVALFLLGMWVWRAGIVQHLDQYKPLLRRACAWCLPIGLAASAYVAAVQVITTPATVSFWRWSASIVWLPGSHILAAGYIAGLALIFLHAGSRRLLQPFAAVGRMALTDYLMQSVVCTSFFYSYGTGLYGKVGPAWGLGATVVLYTAQVAFSNWWLSRYRFGPMEWLWRGMTYGAFPAMRRETLAQLEGVRSTASS